MAVESSANKEVESMELPKYKWDWNDKLSSSPFRKEIKQLKEDNKKHPQNKSSNNEYKRILRAKEKDLLSEFQSKCDQAKIWINQSHEDYANTQNTDDPKIFKQIEYQRKKEKIETIDTFWEELICHETVFIQKEKIRRQNQQMADLEKQLADAQKKLQILNETKNKIKGNDNSKSNDNNNNEKEKQKDQDKKTKKKKKKKKKKDKDEYMGLVGYFNKPRKDKNKNKKPRKATKEPVTDSSDPIDKGRGYLSYQWTPKHDDDDDDEKYKVYEKRQPQNEDNKKPNTDSLSNEMDKIVNDANNEQIEEKKIKSETIIKTKKDQKQKTNKGSMKGGFLSGGTKGLYDDKKEPEDMTVDELNAKNEKQIREMGLKDATNNPIFTWERPKMNEREKMKKEGKDVYGKKGDALGLTQFLDEQAKAADEQ